MARVSDRQVWKLGVMIEATPEQAEAAEEAIARALCPDEHHPGYCEVPWTLLGPTRFEDLDDDERVGWQEAFDEERRRAREAGETNA